jgi:lipid-A-disaccharide synthase
MKQIVIVVGEASGDLLAGNLVVSLRKKNPEIKISGVGGKQMQAAGAHILLNSDELSVVGIFEILSHFGKIRQAFFFLKNLLRQQHPDLLILVDYPGFNLLLAKTAKKMGIKVLYYVSPQIWVWHYRRIYHIKKYVDHMIVLFPFEEELYRAKNIPVTFVGHSIIDQAKASLPKEEIYRQLNLNDQSPIITLMPGSRRQEIKRLLPVMVAAAKLIADKIPRAQFAIALAPSLKKEDLQPHLSPPSLKKEDLQSYLIPNIRIIENHTYNLLAVSAAAIVASGTATLEVTLLEIPMAIIYKLSHWTYPFIKLVTRAKHVGLCNIIAKKCIVKEFLQFQARPKKIAEEILKLINHQLYRQSVIEDLREIRQQIGPTGSADRAADVAISLLMKTAPQTIKRRS